MLKIPKNEKMARQQRDYVMQESFLSGTSIVEARIRTLGQPAGRRVIKNDDGAFPLISSGIGFDAFTALSAA